MDSIELVDQLIRDVTALKGPKLLIAFLIALGYGLQKAPLIDSKYIPRILVLLGIVLAPVLVAWPTPETMEPGVRFNDITAWVQVGVQGFLLACGAWLLHAKILKRMIDDKIGNQPETPAP